LDSELPHDLLSNKPNEDEVLLLCALKVNIYFLTLDLAVALQESLVVPTIELPAEFSDRLRSLR